MKHKNIVVFIAKAGFRASYDAKFTESFIAAKDYLMAKANEIPFTFTISQYFSHTFPIDANRNECVSMAIKNNIDLSIFFDTDHVIPPDTIYKLVKHDKPVVAGVYFLKGEPHPPVIYKENEESSDFNLFNAIYYIGDKSIYEYKELFEADAAGAGCFAVSLDVLKKLKKPYFKYRELPKELIAQDEKQAYSGNKQMDSDMEELLDNWNPDNKFKIQNEIHTATEDLWFWRNIRKNTDAKLLIDPTIVLPHGPLDVWIDSSYSEVFFNANKDKNPDFTKCTVEPIKKDKGVKLKGVKKVPSNGELVDA